MSRTESFQRVWSNDPVPGQFESPPNAIIDLGWQGGAQAQLPEAKWENWWHNRVDEALHEIEENGAPEWFSDIPYKRGALAHAGGKNWVAVIANTDVNPVGAANTGQWKEVVVDVMAAIQAAVPAGAVMHFYRSTAPTGWLKANGEAVSVSTYPALTEAIYVGDARNATAASGYRCTDPANPNGTRSTTGAYIVKPDIRGEFIRGLDDGRSVDGQRLLGSLQSDDIKSHRHAMLGGGGDEGSSSFVDTTAGTNLNTGYTEKFGGAETRPRNVALLACIKY
jgi:hypothetical protein